MSWLDTIIIATVVACVVYSLWRGLVRELISFGALVIAAILATRYCKLGAEHLTGIIGNERLAIILGFVLIFLSILACGILVGRLTKSFLKKAGLSPMDKMLGALLGLLKATMIIAVVLMLIGNFIPDGDEIIDNSSTAPIFMPVANILSDFLPTSLFEKLLKDVKRGVNTFKKYQPDLEKLLPSKLKEGFNETLENGKEALEEDRKKLRKVLRDNL